ncbi:MULTISPECIES: sodium:proton antiporter [Rhodomicrobium]|uniref:sodium:proton antiporter n=1 Tax=Rhodomicrobium TaxID=1068 RepID=UPI001FD997BE|nr:MULTISPECIES: sodium:proton antiporter [Rhodomicrobium]
MTQGHFLYRCFAGPAAIMVPALAFIYVFLDPELAFAAEAARHGPDGGRLGLIWTLPFAGILLSIALLPLLAPGFWHHHYGKVALVWAMAFLAPFAVQFGFAPALDTLLHTLFLEYLPFIILVGSLFTIAGGIFVGGNLHGSPLVNTGFLAAGTGLASIVGTTGASMILIRPLLRANDDRKHCAHTVVFFIFLVSNIGGSLTPLGDPPLFLGFLKGVDFFWPLKAMALPMLTVSGILLAAFFLLDRAYYAREGHLPRDPSPDRPLFVTGFANMALLVLLMGAVLASGTLDLGAVTLRGIELPLSGLARDAALVALAAISLAVTPGQTREANRFTWEPVLEVAKLFAGIFVTIIPAIAILHAGRSGALASLMDLVSEPGGGPNNAMYFWVTGLLSSLLDNAPTYLIFFNAAGGDPAELQGPLANTLLAISAGAVFMGANSYIGNAPNFMVKSIAESQGVPMPSFFGYMAWAAVFLLPVFALITFLFFR